MKASIIAQKGDLKSIADILECTKVSESAGLGKDEDSSDATRINQLMQEVRAGREKVQQLTAKMAKMSVSVAQPLSPTPERRQHGAHQPAVNIRSRLDQFGSATLQCFRHRQSETSGSTWTRTSL